MIINVIFLSLFLLVCLLARRIWKHRNIPEKGIAAIMINIAEVLILHIVLPITLLVMTPVYYQVTPAFFNMHIPDYYAALVLVSVVLVFSGIIKAVFMIGKRI